MASPWRWVVRVGGFDGSSHGACGFGDLLERHVPGVVAVGAWHVVLGVVDACDVEGVSRRGAGGVDGPVVPQRRDGRGAQVRVLGGECGGCED